MKLLQALSRGPGVVLRRERFVCCSTDLYSWYITGGLAPVTYVHVCMHFYLKMATISVSKVKAKSNKNLSIAKTQYSLATSTGFFWCLYILM